MSIPDKLLINLRILGNVQKNGRIARSYDGIISIEGDNFYQPLKRFLTSDSRKQAIHEISSIMNECAEIMNHISSSKMMNVELAQTEEFFKGCENLNILLKEMKGAKIGIENLKFTYGDDINIVSQIDVIILKFSNIIRDLGFKLSFFESALTNLNNTNLNSTNYNSLQDRQDRQDRQQETVIDINLTDINCISKV